MKLLFSPNNNKLTALKRGGKQNKNILLGLSHFVNTFIWYYSTDLVLTGDQLPAM